MDEDQKQVATEQDNGDQSTENRSNDRANEEFLSDIQRRAVEALTPVIDSIEDAPERKFELLMNAVRASDNVKLLEKSLSAAEAIQDPATKAEALVEIINEASFRQNR